MKNKKIIIIPIVVIIIGLLSFGLFYFLNNEDEQTTLSLLDKQWIENNKNNKVDLSIFTGVSTISDNGVGLIFDFLNSLKNDTTITFNNIAYQIGSEPKTDYSFKLVEKQGENQLLLYRDNKILVSNKEKSYSNLNEIKDIKIGVLKSDKKRVEKYLSICDNVTFVEYETVEDMIAKLLADESEIDSIIVSRLINLEEILSNEKLYISYNLTDLTDDYVLDLGNVDKLNEILSKYFNKWKSNNIEQKYDEYLSSNLLNYTNVDEKAKADFKGKRYTYGFVENAPYDLTVDGTLMGMNKSVIDNFANTFGLEIVYKKYNSYQDLKKAFDNNQIDIFFDTYSNSDYQSDNSVVTLNYNEQAVVLTNKYRLYIFFNRGASNNITKQCFI